MDRKEMQNARLYLLTALLVLVLIAYFFVLYDVQVIHHDEYAAKAIRSIVRSEKVEASRGILTDRNGKPLVSNRSTYDLTFDADLLRPGEDSNEAILRLVQLCQAEGVAWSDNLPISRLAPYAYTVNQMDKQQKKLFLAYLKTLKPCAEALGEYLLRHPEAVSTPEPEPEEGAAPMEELSPKKRAQALLDRLVPDDLTEALLMDAGVTPAQLIGAMRGELGIPEDYTMTQARMVLGVQYELSVRKLDNYAAYVLARDIDTPFISLLSDGNYAGAKVTLSSVREYETPYAAHILGYVSSITIEDDYPSLKEKGYDYDDLIGKVGAELAFEEYLRGKDGRRMVATNDEGKVTGEYYSTEPVPGNTVELTIDLNFQSQVEDCLAETVTRLNADGDEKRGAGAAVVRVGTGEVLALASYPSYDLATFRRTEENYVAVSSDPQAPLFNRAAEGKYPPRLHLEALYRHGGPAGREGNPKRENQGHRLLALSGGRGQQLRQLLEALGPREPERHRGHHQLLQLLFCRNGLPPGNGGASEIPGPVRPGGKDGHRDSRDRRTPAGEPPGPEPGPLGGLRPVQPALLPLAAGQLCRHPGFRRETLPGPFAENRQDL